MKFKFVFFALFFIIASNLFAGSKKSNLFEKKIDPMGETWCGQLNQQKCGPSTKEYWEMGGCDYGLKSKWSWSEWKSYCRMGSRKSASIPSWLSKTLQFQRSLSKDLHINKTVSIGAHNTQAPKETSGSLLLLQGNIQPNQKYSITDLLDMGVRRLSIDVHNFNRTIRVCHGNMSHIGCSPRARYWAAWIEELKNWMDLPNNKNEIVILQIENWLDGNVEDFIKPVNAYIKSLALKTSDKPRHNWPTQKWLINNKKRLIIFVQNDIDKLNQLSGNIFFKQGHYFHPGWPGNYAESFYGLQGNCRVANHGGLASGSGERNTQHWRVISEDRSFLTHLLEVFNKTFTDNKGHKTIDNNMIKEITTCNISGWEMDFAVPERMNHAVWTWETGHPYNWGRGSDCALMKGSDGRWISSNCNGKAYYACVNKNNPYDWKLSDEKGSWDEGDIRCQKLGNYKLGLPLNGYQNNLINEERVNEADHVWIKHSKGKTQKTSLNSSSSKKSATAQFTPGFYKIKNELSKKYLTYLWRNYTIQYSNLKFSSYWNKRQIWEIINIKGDLYQIKNSVTSRCLEANHNRNGAIIYAENCRAKNDQLWKIKNMGSARYQVINSAFSNCMDIQGSTRYKHRNWLRPMTWKCYNVRQHKFIFEAER
jgi:hypothetical protein